MEPFSLRHVSIHGHDVMYRMSGEGPTLLLIHGIAGSSNTWRQVMPALAEHHTVVAPDLLGHGESAKPIGDYSLGAYASGLRDFLAVIGVPSATIVGHSFGGGVAMQLAYQHPECAERLVLVGSGGLGREVSWLLRLLALPGSELFMPLLFPPFFRNRGSDVGRFLHRHNIRSARADEMWRSYASLGESPNRKAFLRTLRSVVSPGGQTVSAMDRLYLAAAIPTLIVWGEKDDIIPVSHAYDAHAVLPESRLEIMEDAAHFPHAEEPERFVEILLDFMAATDAGTAGPERHQRLLLTGGHAPPAVAS